MRVPSEPENPLADPAWPGEFRWVADPNDVIPEYVPERRRRRWPRVAVALLAVAAVGVAAWHIGGDRLFGVPNPNHPAIVAAARYNSLLSAGDPGAAYRLTCRAEQRALTPAAFTAKVGERPVRTKVHYARVREGLSAVATATIWPVHGPPREQETSLIWEDARWKVCDPVARPT